jgi:hypothetical protein
MEQRPIRWCARQPRCRCVSGRRGSWLSYARPLYLALRSRRQSDGSSRAGSALSSRSLAVAGIVWLGRPRPYPWPPWMRGSRDGHVGFESCQEVEHVDVLAARLERLPQSRAHDRLLREAHRRTVMLDTGIPASSCWREQPENHSAALFQQMTLPAFSRFR